MASWPALFILLFVCLVSINEAGYGQQIFSSDETGERQIGNSGREQVISGRETISNEETGGWQIIRQKKDNDGATGGRQIFSNEEDSSSYEVIFLIDFLVVWSVFCDVC